MAVSWRRRWLRTNLFAHTAPRAALAINSDGTCGRRAVSRPAGERETFPVALPRPGLRRRLRSEFAELMNFARGYPQLITTEHLSGAPRYDDRGGARIAHRPDLVNFITGWAEHLRLGASCRMFLEDRRRST